ncbi:flavin reductase [Bacteriovorax sp. BSW11_IV]|uniref:NADPH-dependent FMN reductase n=1 Tax=Bacteriovorax sp. BSW11_IV TaxID=1353529 RepID=UPI00038A18D9|nr:NAD(P)H-dependent oxidoreductase [Bacteriovorax sp. BSW11_IV]EQC49156.1 flavin reductase [Bacteriovorax sp. BSW11_IV]
MAKVVILSATSGNNFKLANALCEEVVKHGGLCEVVNLEELDLPLYSPKSEANGVPDKAKELTAKIAESHSMIWVAPEYNGSIPPVMNNAIAWVSRATEDWRDGFNGKFAVVATHSGGGGDKVCAAMKQTLEHLGTVVLPRTIVTTYKKELNPKSADAIVTQLLKHS